MLLGLMAFGRGFALGCGRGPIELAKGVVGLFPAVRVVLATTEMRHGNRPDAQAQSSTVRTLAKLHVVQVKGELDRKSVV